MSDSLAYEALGLIAVCGQLRSAVHRRSSMSESMREVIGRIDVLRELLDIHVPQDAEPTVSTLSKANNPLVLAVSILEDAAILAAIMQCHIFQPSDELLGELTETLATMEQSVAGLSDSVGTTVSELRAAGDPQ